MAAGPGGWALAQDTVDQFAAQYWPEKQQRARLLRDLGIITLMLAGAAIQAWNIRSNDDAWTDYVSGATLKRALLAAGCSLAGLILAARSCREAATWLEAEPGLPTARVIEPR